MSFVSWSTFALTPQTDAEAEDNDAWDATGVCLSFCSSAVSLSNFASKPESDAETAADAIDAEAAAVNDWLAGCGALIGGAGTFFGLPRPGGATVPNGC